jgi:hypothetical protein
MGHDFDYCDLHSRIPSCCMLNASPLSFKMGIMVTSHLMLLGFQTKFLSQMCIM